MPAALRQWLSSSIARWALILLGAAIYASLFLYYHPRGYRDIAALSIFPAMLAGFFFGMRIGVGTGAAVFLLNTVLYNIVLGGGPGAVIMWRGLAASLAAVVAGGLIGRLHDLNQRLNTESGERIRVQVTASEERLLADALREGITALNSTLNLHEVLRRILENVGRVVPHDAANMMLVDSGYATVAGRVGYEVHDIDAEMLEVRAEVERTSGFRQILSSGRPLVIPDTGSFPGWTWFTPNRWIRSYLGAPIRHEGEVIGLLNLDSKTPNFYTAAHAERLMIFADQAAIAIHNARIHESEQKRAVRLELISKISQQVMIADNLDRLLYEALALIAATFDYNLMSLGLIEGEHLVFKALYFPTNTTRQTTFVRLGEGITGWVALHGEPQVVADVTKDPRYVVWEDDSRSEMAIPIKLRGVVIGVLNVENMKPNAFSDSDVELIQPVADQLAIIIENGVLYDRIRRRQRYLETLRRVSQRAAPERDPNRFLQAITDALADEFNFPMVAILLGDDENRELRLVAHSGEGFSRLSVSDPTSIRQSYDLGILGHVIRTNRIYMAADTSQDQLYYTFGDRLPPGSQIAVPIRQHEKTVAVLSVETFQTNQFDEIDAQAITELANDLGISLENVTLNQRVATHAADMEQRVTERTAELLAAKERLEDLDKLKSKFMADVSHGLRTPITNLGLYMDLLSQRPDDPERVKQYVETIRDQTARLTEIVEDVLSLSRLESSREELDFRPVDLNNIVTSAVKVFAPRAERNGLTLSAVPADELPAVLGEPQQMRQMITNLVENAILYTRDGDIRLTTAYDGQSGKVQLCVIDTGMGIEQDELEHIFDRFYRGKKIGESDIRGSGLGLAIVKEIIDLHEGTISVESTHGEGTTFTILLPAHIDTSSA